MNNWWESLKQGKIWQGELINCRKNGEIYWEEALITPVKDAASVTTHYVAVKIELPSASWQNNDCVKAKLLPMRFLIHYRHTLPY